MRYNFRYQNRETMRSSDLVVEFLMDEDGGFGRWLRRRRKALDLTQHELAQRVGCAEGTIRKLEAGDMRPSKQTSERLAEQLGVPVTDRAAFVSFARSQSESTPFSLLAGDQSGPAREPAPASVPPPRTNLPSPPTPLIGRADEVAAVRDLVLDADVRLVSLLGPPGVGKTRLALRVAADLADSFADGTIFVALAPISNLDLVLPTIAKALDIVEGSGQPLFDQLVAYLHDRCLLLLIDNVEQVVDAAAQLAGLLAATRRLKLLVTSRVALRLSGEHEYVVPPLALPDLLHLPALEALATCPAIALLSARAQAARASFVITPKNAPSVAAICHRLDGLPLAIELVATRLKVLTPETLLARLDRSLPLLTGGARDLPARQQTLYTAIAWSHELLSPYERTLFARLSVFVGGWTLDAAEAVCDDVEPDVPLAHSSMPDRLASLIDKSLLQREAGPDGELRFVMLTTIREYALEHLAEHGESEAVRRRHAQYYLRLAEQAEPALQGPDQQRWLERLEADHDNIRAALAWSLAAGEAEIGLRIAGAIWWFWWASSHAGEGRDWLKATLAQSSSRTVVRAKSLYAIGMLTLFVDRHAASRLLQEALSLYQELDHHSGCAATMVNLGWQLTFDGDSAAGASLVEQGVALYRAEPVVDHWGLGFALVVVELLAMQQGDYATARTAGEEALALFRELGQAYGIAQALNYLGDVARLQGDFATATTWYEESLVLLRELALKRAIPAVLHNMGYVLLAYGQIQRAATAFVESLTLQRENGDQQGIAECLAGLAAVAAVLRQPERAARLFAAAEAVHTATDGPIWPAEQAEYERHRAAAVVELEPAAWESAWAAGRAMPLERAIVEATAVVVAS